MSSKTVSHLVSEHQAIKRVLRAFENFLDEVESSTDEQLPERAAPQRLWKVIDYLGESFFLRHEEKEEGVLLPQLARQGYSWTDGTLSHVRKEHRHGRYLMRSLRHAVHQTRSWSRDDRRHFLSIGREWTAFLRRHMDAEEELLFPNLAQDIDAELDTELLKQFESIDRDFDQMEDAQELREAGERFAEDYGSSAA